jgi:hypothetical protein
MPHLAPRLSMQYDCSRLHCDRVSDRPGAGVHRVDACPPQMMLLGVEQDSENPNSDYDERHREDYWPDFI